MIQTQCRTACKWAQIWAWTCTMQTFLNTREHWMKTHTYHPNPPNDTLLLLSILSVWPSQQSLLPLSSGNCVLCWQSSSMGVCIYIYTHTLSVYLHFVCLCLTQALCLTPSLTLSPSVCLPFSLPALFHLPLHSCCCPICHLTRQQLSWNTGWQSVKPALKSDTLRDTGTHISAG